MGPEPAVLKTWDCPRCGSRESWVRDTAKDEDGFIVRRRVCDGCGQQRSTEERVISENSSGFYARAHSRREMQKRLRKQHRPKRSCRYCGEPYPSGSFSRHVGTSKIHNAAIKPPANGSTRETVRAWQRARARALVRARRAEPYVSDNYGPPNV